jgi:hypothetical protein
VKGRPRRRGCRGFWPRGYPLHRDAYHATGLTARP